MSPPEKNGSELLNNLFYFLSSGSNCDLRSISSSGSTEAGPTEISRKKITRTFFGGNDASDMDDDQQDDEEIAYDSDSRCRTTTTSTATTVEKRRNKVSRKSVRSAGTSVSRYEKKTKNHSS